ncbi:hypothetical protein HDE_08431 [Halotydeus destructor]|nr:hypothetical protein HDE_08431 [Halotydeus destructor]
MKTKKVIDNICKKLISSKMDPLDQSPDYAEKMADAESSCFYEKMTSCSSGTETGRGFGHYCPTEEILRPWICPPGNRTVADTNEVKEAILKSTKC